MLLAMLMWPFAAGKYRTAISEFAVSSHKFIGMVIA